MTGATPAERDLIRAAFEASAIDMAALDRSYGGIHIIIADEWPPYWELAPDVEVISMDVLPAAIGLAYSDGTVVVKGDLEWSLDSMALEVLTHELTHLEWFRRDVTYWREWRNFISAGLPTPPVTSWSTNSAEAYAEHGRRFWWPTEFWVTERPRTELRVLSESEFLAWVAAHTTTTTTTLPPSTTSTTQPPPTTTTTTPRGDPFPDVARVDTELWAAAWWGRDEGIVFGYSGGRLGPYDALTRRHAALMIGRAGGAFAIPWVFDYAPVTRGELAERYDYPMDPGREGEPLLRSQLLRLLWRAR